MLQGLPVWYICNEHREGGGSETCCISPVASLGLDSLLASVVLRFPAILEDMWDNITLYPCTKAMFFTVNWILKLPCFPLNHLTLVHVCKGFQCRLTAHLFCNTSLLIKPDLLSPKWFIRTFGHLFYTECTHSNRNHLGYPWFYKRKL